MEFDSRVGENILRINLGFGELKYLAEWYFSSELPSEKNFKSVSRKRYGNLLRYTGYVREVNRLLLFLDTLFYGETGIVNCLTKFTDEYNQIADGLKLDEIVLEYRSWDEGVFEDVVYPESAVLDTRDAVRGAISVDYNRSLAYGEYSNHNHARKIAAGVAREKRENARMALDTCPELRGYDELPKDVIPGFMKALKKVYMEKMLENGCCLEDIFVSFDRELYRTLPDPASERIMGLYRDFMQEEGIDAGFAVDYLIAELRKTMWGRRDRPVYFDADHGENRFLSIKEASGSIYLGREAVRRRVRDGRLRGIKRARGKYVINPRAYSWVIDNLSIRELRKRYAYDFSDRDVILMGGSIDEVSGLLGERCYTPKMIASLDGMPAIRTIRERIKEKRLGVRALVSGIGEKMIVPESKIWGIR